MICTMCSPGVLVDEMWACPCGERHCQHIWECDKCFTLRIQRAITVKETADKHCAICHYRPLDAGAVLVGSAWMPSNELGVPRPEATSQVTVLCRECYKGIALLKHKQNAEGSTKG